MIFPLEELARHGHEVTLKSARLDRTHYGKVHIVTASDFTGGQYDVIVGQRFSSYDGVAMWRKARTPFSRLVYENDDDVFSVTMENWAAYQHYTRADVEEAIIASCEAADLVTVTVETLADVHRQYNPNVAVLPNCLPPQAYRDRHADASGEWTAWRLACEHAAVGRADAVPGDSVLYCGACGEDQAVAEVAAQGRVTTGRKVLGWAGGASHARDIHVATPAVRRFLRQFPDWDLALNGTDFRSSFKVPEARVTYTPWVNMIDNLDLYYELLSPFDIGICPVLDTKFARSKSAIKAIEYSAQGIPVIASDVQPYREFITHGETGFLARTDHEWLRYLRELASDEELRLSMGNAARERAREYAIKDRWTDWEAAYQRLFKKAA